jgi:hypothetical protein
MPALVLLTCVFANLIGLGSLAAADKAADEAIKVLTKDWGGHGGSCVRLGLEGKKLTEVAYQFLLCESKAYFFIAGVDLSSDFQSMHSGPLAEGMLKAKDEKTIRWSCTSKDGKTAEVKIGDKKYDLKNGSIFWVFRKGEKWEVYQTKVDPRPCGQSITGMTILALRTRFRRPGHACSSRDC